MANGISFNATHSPYYTKMVKKIIVVGPSYTPLGDNKMRTSLLDKGETRMVGTYGRPQTIMDSFRMFNSHE